VLGQQARDYARQYDWARLVGVYDELLGHDAPALGATASLPLVDTTL
jgi:hypothetical protein